jgi:hypothetical protein
VEEQVLSRLVDLMDQVQVEQVEEQENIQLH